jgi:hypothetical protein
LAASSSIDNPALLDNPFEEEGEETPFGDTGVTGSVTVVAVAVAVGAVCRESEEEVEDERGEVLVMANIGW